MFMFMLLNLDFLCVCVLCNVGFFYLSFPSREDKIPWNSNVIVERVSNYTVKTVSGRVYILVGKMYNSIHTGKPDSVIFSNENDEKNKENINVCKYNTVWIRFAHFMHFPLPIVEHLNKQ